MACCNSVDVGKVKVQARIIGKVATVLQMVVVLWIMLKWEEKWLAALTLGTGHLHRHFRTCFMFGTEARVERAPVLQFPSPGLRVQSLKSKAGTSCCFP